MNRKIPLPVIAVVSDIFATRYTHGRIDYFMAAVGIDGNSPAGNKTDKTREWLRRANEITADPLAALAKAITEFMEVDGSGFASRADLSLGRQRVESILRDSGLAYMSGGYVVPVGATAVGMSFKT
jgi:hypothetical protein